MAKYQYRMFGDLQWLSSSGNALFALYNKAGSGKKITIRSLEIYNNTTRSVATQLNYVTLARVDTVDGTPLGVTSLNSTAASLSGVSVFKNCTMTGTPQVLRRVAIAKQRNPAAALTADCVNAATTPGSVFRGSISASRNRGAVSGVVEGARISSGEALCCYADSLQCSIPLKMDLMFRVVGTGSTYCTSTLVNVLRPNDGLFGIANPGASQVELLRWGVTEVGTFDSPYLQLVPISSIDPSALADDARSMQITKMDSQYPDPGTFVRVVADTPVGPYGVPSEYASSGGAATPKGFSYLGTKDFAGPLWRTMFPEFTGAAGPDVKPDSHLLGHGHRWADMLVRHSGIVVRDGESVAMVSAAETAVLSSAVGVSGWSSFTIGISFDVEPTQLPTISLSGMIEGSRYRVERVSDGSAILTGVADATGAVSYEYDGEVPISVRVRVRKASDAPYYKPYEVTFLLTASGVSLPVSQIPDD